MNIRLIAALAVGVCVASAGYGGDAAKGDAAKFQGTWKIKVLKTTGSEVPFRKDAPVAIQGDRLRSGPGKNQDDARFKLDPTQKPKAIDLQAAVEANAGAKPFLKDLPKQVTLKGIYEVRGDTLRMCFALPGEERPTEFSTKSASGWLLIVLERGNR